MENVFATVLNRRNDYAVIAMSPFLSGEVVRGGPCEFRASLVIPENLPCFAGHFPGRPILPGSLLVDISLALLAREGNPSPLRAVKSAKFSGFVKPREPIAIAFDSPREKIWNVKWSVAGAPCAELVLELV